MNTVTALLIVLAHACMSGATAGNYCPDGTEPFQAEMSVLSGEVGPRCTAPLDEHHWAKCIAHWQYVIQLRAGDRILFTLRPDGTVEHDPAYSVDQAGSEFYQALYNTAPWLREFPPGGQK